jgi:sugar phosphate permease
MVGGAMIGGTGTRPKPKLFYGWVIVAVVAMAGFTQATETFSVLSVFLKPITQEFSWTRSEFAGAMSIGGLLGSLVAVSIGPLIDRFGSRWALVLAFAVLGATFVLMPLMSSLWHFYVLQILARMMNTGVLGVASAVIIPQWFIAKRGRAIALSEMGHGMGSTVTPIYVQLMVSAWNWRVAAATAGVLMWVVSALPAAMFLRRRPEDLGLLPDGAPTEETGRHRAASREASGGGPRAPEIAVTLHQALRMPTFYLLTVAMPLGWIARTGLSLHAIPFFTDRGLAPELAVAVIALHSAFGILGMVGAGFLAERVNPRLLLSVDYLLNGLAFPLLLLTRSAPTALLWGVFYGLVQGATFILQRIILADYFGRRHLGSIQGVMRAVQNVAQAAGPIVAALAYDATGSYTLIFAIFGVIAASSGIFIYFARPPAPPATDG